MNRTDVVPLAIFFVLVAAAAFTGSRFMPDVWYRSLSKPPWNPPDWVFAPVWTVLYVLIALAGFLVWKSAGRVNAALVLWVAQMIFNALWTWLFFGRCDPALALADIAMLLVCIVAFMVVARATSPTASWFFAPYAAWVIYASSLNLWIWLKNRHV